MNLQIHEEAVKLGKEYLDIMPVDVYMIYKVSETLKILKQYDIAIELEKD